MSYNLIVTGVGGQGSILATRIIADAAIATSEHNEKKINVLVGETFGAAMRGGSVMSHVRIGPDVYGPLIPQYGASEIVALEPMEGLRIALKFLAPGGTAIFNTTPIMPVDVKVGVSEYPSLHEISAAIEKINGRLVYIDGSKLAAKAGNLRTLSSVMLGALIAVGKPPVNKDFLMQAIYDRVPSKTIDANFKAFELGFTAGQKNRGVNNA
jgi:indolepyruvate ferredoxin oxidoreductase beta subunit